MIDQETIINKITPVCDLKDGSPVSVLEQGVDKEMLCMSEKPCPLKSMYDEHLVCLFNVYKRIHDRCYSGGI